MGICPVEVRCTELGRILDPGRSRLVTLEPAVHTADTAGQVDRDQGRCRTACDPDVA